MRDTLRVQQFPIPMDSHSFFNVRVWNLRSEGFSISEIAKELSLGPKVVLQRLSFDAFNKHVVTESELEEANLDWSDAHGYGIEVSD